MVFSAKKISGIFKGALDGGADAAEAAAKRGASLAANLGNISELKKSMKTVDDAEDLVLYLGKNADTVFRDLSKSELQNLGKAIEPFAKDSKSIMKLTGDSPSTIAKATQSAGDFFKRNEKTLLTAGLSVGAITILMLITGESDPAKAIGDQVGSLAGSVGSAAGEGAKSFFDGLGIGDFFSKWGLYIGIFCAILLMLGVFMMLK